MTILSDSTIAEWVLATKWRRENGHEVNHAVSFLIEPFVEWPKQVMGMSYGLSQCGYDIRLGKINRPGATFSGDKPGGNKTPKENAAQSWLVKPGDFLLLASLERFEIPHDLAATVLDKSTLARKGLALQNTILEPGWKGYITLELSNHGPESVRIFVGQPIAQVVFHILDQPVRTPYHGKYQNQGADPTPAILLADTPS